MTTLTGIVLAAGRGTRMGRLGSEVPKTLLPVGPEPVIGHHLEMMSALGIRDATVVVGHRADEVAEAVGDGSRWGVRVSYVEQDAPRGSAHAVGLLRSRIDGPFLLVLGDYYLRASSAFRLVRRGAECASAIGVKVEPNRQALREACEVRVDAEDRVTEIVEKPMRPSTPLKGCGLYLMQPEFLDAAARTPRTALRDEYEITVAIELFVRMGYPVWAERVVEADRNLTRPVDVLEANLEWLEHKERRSMIVDGARVDAGVRLDRSVVSARCRIQGTGALEETVVLPGSHLEVDGVLRRAIVTPSGMDTFPERPLEAGRPWDGAR